MKTVVAFGEVMLRLSPPGALRFPQTDLLEMSFGGAEVNVAVALAQLGTPASFVTRLPDHEVAKACLQRVRAAGVSVDRVLRGGHRMGTYFVERGGGARSAAVTYDRRDSAIATIDPAELDWNAILADAAWLHLSGITPALSAAAAKAAFDGCVAARSLGVPTSLDVNFRATLWSAEAAGKKLSPFLDVIDPCICNETHARLLFGVDGADDAAAADILALRHGNLSRIAVTRRRTVDALRDRWRATLRTPAGTFASTEHEITMVERVGGGDSFSAGLIHAVLSGRSDADAVEFGAAALAYKHTIGGDFASFSENEVDAFRASGGGGVVQR
ncbi:MAG: sugar kinase [Armatimonadota bacterium]